MPDTNPITEAAREAAKDLVPTGIAEDGILVRAYTERIEAAIRQAMAKREEDVAKLVEAYRGLIREMKILGYGQEARPFPRSIHNLRNALRPFQENPDATT